MNVKQIAKGLIALGVAMLSGSGAAADATRDAIAERLAPVGSVCLQGQECGTAAGTAAQGEAAAESGSELDGASLYTSTGCAACHDSGAAGAPLLGDTQAWSARLEEGTEVLYQSVYEGKGAMPARGGSSASDEEIQAVVDYMIAEAE
ncbi:Cytochrome c5 [Vreelandella subterranea]|uniref:Cytochrome c5 n=1 Tax=Vreelandella subterranea TaxID=416874 RepID=A0A1H9PZD0_9GAMM|nr:c-type cytochrome [Halomonas subterranea]SER53591.1 Cytochrome c5 [Halomonas subterranea]